MKADDLCDVCSFICDDVVAADNYEEAISFVLGEEKTVVFGSLYLAGDIRPLLIKQFKTKNN
jgi:folylpolyglutamate synthase/dihydropteroate synthase